MNLLGDANKSCSEVQVGKKTFYGASSRYNAESTRVHNNTESSMAEVHSNIVGNSGCLEDEMTCSGCDEPAENFISTAAGNICLPCFQNQDRPTGDKRDRMLAGSRQEEAKINQNKALMGMGMESVPGTSGMSGKRKKDKTKGAPPPGRCETDTDDDKLAKILLSQLQETFQDNKKKMKLEQRKLELDIMLRERKLGVGNDEDSD